MDHAVLGSELPMISTSDLPLIVRSVAAGLLGIAMFAVPADAQTEWVPSRLSSGPFIELQTLDRLHSPLLRNDLQLQGAQSCAAASCHGGPHPGVAQAWNSRGSEYPLWLENDPHARSWRTICSDESVAMMQRLGIMQGNQIVDQQGFDNCLLVTTPPNALMKLVP